MQRRRGGGWGIDWSSSQLNHHPSMPRPPLPAASDGDGDGESGDGVHGGRPSYAVSETRSQVATFTTTGSVGPTITLP